MLCVHQTREPSRFSFSLQTEETVQILKAAIVSFNVTSGTDFIRYLTMLLEDELLTLLPALLYLLTALAW